MKKIAVILSGCGVKDGSEIHEATLLLLAIDKLGAEAVCFAPNKGQSDVIDHFSGNVMPEKRNVLVESARIARGAVQPLSKAKVADLDAAILPGGFGAAKNLCTFAREGSSCEVDGTLSYFLHQMHAANKPIGASCIAPVILAQVFGKEKPLLTIGKDAETAAVVETMGATHRAVGVKEIVVDQKLKLVTTPCYMLPARISEVSVGMETLAKAVLDLCN